MPCIVLHPLNNCNQRSCEKVGAAICRLATGRKNETRPTRHYPHPILPQKQLFEASWGVVRKMGAGGGGGQSWGGGRRVEVVLGNPTHVGHNVSHNDPFGHTYVEVQ